MSTDGAERTSRWPNNARAAVAFTLDNMGEAADLDRGLWPESQPIGRHHSVTEVLPQILSILKEHQIPATYFVESWNLSVYPNAIDLLLEHGHELAWHAWRHEAWGKLDAEAEQENFRRSFGDKGLQGFIESRQGKATGNIDRYRGFRPPGGIVHGQRSIKLCKEYGLKYISPAGQRAATYRATTNGDDIVVLPFKWESVDAYYYMEPFSGLRKLKGQLPEEPQSPAVLMGEYRKLIDQAIADGGYVSTLFHPFLTNTPERLEALKTIVEYLDEKRAAGEIWLARCRDIADFIEAHPDVVGTNPELDLASWR